MLLAVHQDQGQSANVTGLGGHARRIGHRLRQTLGRVRSGLGLRRGKCKVAGRFQFPQRLQAAIELCLTARVVEPAFLAQEIRQLAAVDELATIQQFGDIRNGSRLRQRPLDLAL